MDKLAGSVESNNLGFLENLVSFIDKVWDIQSGDALLRCGVSNGALDLLGDWLSNAGPVVHVIGNGLQRHGNARGNLLAIQALAAIHGEDGGGLFVRQGAIKIFNNQLSGKTASFKGRLLDLNNPTAKMANLVLPTTTYFEELDIVVNDWHKGMAFNEKAVAPYHESRCEWIIMKEFALRLEETLPGSCSFPIHSSEEEYLEAQFNDRVHKLYGVKKLADLRGRVAPVFPAKGQEGKISDLSLKNVVGNEGKRIRENGNAGARIDRGLALGEKLPTTEPPFWLITPHHPYRLNSQFHFLNLSDEKEAYIGINPRIAQKLGIFETWGRFCCSTIYFQFKFLSLTPTINLFHERKESLVYLFFETQEPSPCFTCSIFWFTSCFSFSFCPRIVLGFGV
ncbi:molybdopterin-dependent oxidoreductase [Bacillus sp. B15-48]|nr:molybdopterin-dependent oxidoreductase [Bacillus sp. B15-48]